MDGDDAPAEAPTASDLASVFHVYDVRTDGDTVLYVGEPRVGASTLERQLWPLFRDHGYEVRLQEGYSGSEGPGFSRAEYVLVAQPRSIGIDGIPWWNIGLFVATVLSTLFVGASEFYRLPVVEDPLSALQAWPFSAAILGILLVHEFGHYLASRYHGVDASLPYFIPVPTLIGTMGAVIRMRGRMPDRRALFDIGASGPLAGLVATVVVAAIGMQLDPLPVQEAAATAAQEGGAEGTFIVFNDPPLLQLVGAAVAPGTIGPTEPLHPVYFGAWVGALVTFLNLLPVGQLDGGHVLRAMLGRTQERLAAAVPGALFALAAYLYLFDDGVFSGGIWLLWGGITAFMTYMGPVSPVHDEPLGRRRQALGVVAFLGFVLCFVPVPIDIVAASAVAG